MDPVWRKFGQPFHRGYTLGQAAADGQIIEERCKLCRRVVRYLASDLVKLSDPGRHALQPTGHCAHCGKSAYIKVSLRLPAPGDYGSLPIMRPVKRVVLQWYSVQLGDEPPG